MHSKSLIDISLALVNPFRCCPYDGVHARALPYTDGTSKERRVAYHAER